MMNTRLRFTSAQRDTERATARLERARHALTGGLDALGTQPFDVALAELFASEQHLAQCEEIEAVLIELLMMEAHRDMATGGVLLQVGP